MESIGGFASSRGGLERRAREHLKVGEHSMARQSMTSTVVDFDSSSVLDSSSLPSPRVFQVKPSKSSSPPSLRVLQVLESSEYNMPKTQYVFESSSLPEYNILN